MTRRSPACRVRGTSPLASRAWREGSMETMAGADATGADAAPGVAAGAWNARRSAGASRASFGVTRLLYGRKLQRFHEQYRSHLVWHVNEEATRAFRPPESSPSSPARQ